VATLIPNKPDHYLYRVMFDIILS